MLPTCDETARAVVFIKGNEVIGEMLYSEFDAVLDSFIPLPNFAGLSVNGIYLEINYRLHVTSAVFFLINFDLEGFADRKWNIPLQHLADAAAKGPDLGSGPIKLACFTQCPIQWHKRNLWDPEMSPVTNHFALLRRTITANKMGIVFQGANSVEAPTADIEIPTLTSVEERRLEKGWRDEIENELRSKLYRGFRNRLANTLKEQRLRLATARNRYRQRVDALGREHQLRLEKMKGQYQELESTYNTQKLLADELKQTVDRQAEKMTHLREYFEEKIKSAKNISEEQINLLHQQFELEASAKIESISKDLKEKLQLREIEVMYLSEHQKNLIDEIESLKQEKQKLQEYSGDKVIDQLAQSGIHFVAYQSGLGHINISRDEINQYIENPEAFAAQKCGVSVTTYRQWLEHFAKPTCQALNRDGSVCGCSIPRISSPIDFHSGESDRCEEHSQNNVVNLRFGK